MICLPHPPCPLPDDSFRALCSRECFVLHLPALVSSFRVSGVSHGRSPRTAPAQQPGLGVALHLPQSFPQACRLLRGGSWDMSVHAGCVVTAQPWRAVAVTPRVCVPSGASADVGLLIGLEGPGAIPSCRGRKGMSSEAVPLKLGGCRCWKRPDSESPACCPLS